MKIATAIRAALAKSGTPLDTAPSGPTPALDLDTAAISATLGYAGRANGGVYAVKLARGLRAALNETNSRRM